MVPAFPAPDAQPQTGSSISLSEYRAIHSEWINFINSGAKDTNSRERLLKKGTPALEVMMDLLFGPQHAEVKGEEIEKLVNQLGVKDFKSREAAQQKLESMVCYIRGTLEKHAQHADPEIAERVRNILSKAKELELDPKLIPSALSACTDILQSSWPTDEIRSVVRKNLKRLAGVKAVEHHWDARPLGPLLGSLRHSDVAADRQLLAEFAGYAEDGAAVVCLSVMKQGLTGLTNPRLGDYWKKVPEHDYSEAVLTLIDPTRPAVFKEAMYAAPRVDKLKTKLHDALSRINDNSLKEDVYTFLWHFMSDPLARDHFYENLNSPEFETFSTAVYRLTDCNFQYCGQEIIPKLRPVIKGNDPKRRKLVLGRLCNYLGKESVTLAAAEEAPFLASEDGQEQTIAKKVLLELQNSGWVDVLSEIAAKHENADVRAAAAQLHAEWKKSRDAAGKAGK